MSGKLTSAKSFGRSRRASGFRPAGSSRAAGGPLALSELAPPKAVSNSVAEQVSVRSAFCAPWNLAPCAAEVLCAKIRTARRLRALTRKLRTESSCQAVLERQNSGADSSIRRNRKPFFPPKSGTSVGHPRRLPRFLKSSSRSRPEAKFPDASSLTAPSVPAHSATASCEPQNSGANLLQQFSLTGILEH